MKKLHCWCESQTRGASGRAIGDGSTDVPIQEKGTEMRVAILGAGAIAYGNAALMCQNVHDVILWSPSGRRTAAIATGAPLHSSGAVSGSYHPRIATSCADALAEAEAVVIAVPGYGHRFIIESAAPHVRDDQVIVFSSHLSFAALYLNQLLGERGVTVPIATLATTVTTGRQTSLDTVYVGAIRALLDVAVIPKESTARGIEVCRTLFGDRFQQQTGLLAISLSNLNPQNHLAIALCNLTRMELGEKWGQNENITPAVARFIEALDLERLAIAHAFGLNVRTVQEHFRLSNDVPLGTLHEMVQHRMQRPGPFGPTSLDSRYVTEDMPFGLAPTISIAHIAGVKVPLHESGLCLMSALYGRDFAAENDILPSLGRLTREMLAELG